MEKEQKVKCYSVHCSQADYRYRYVVLELYFDTVDVSGCRAAVMSDNQAYLRLEYLSDLRNGSWTVPYMTDATIRLTHHSDTVETLPAIKRFLGDDKSSKWFFRNNLFDTIQHLRRKKFLELPRSPGYSIVRTTSNIKGEFCFSLMDADEKFIRQVYVPLGSSEEDVRFFAIQEHLEEMKWTNLPWGYCPRIEDVAKMATATVKQLTYETLHAQYTIERALDWLGLTLQPAEQPEPQSAVQDV